MLSRISAHARRRRAARDIARRMADLDRLDREYGLGAMPSAAPSRVRRSRRSSGTVLSLVVTAGLVAGLVAFSPAEELLAVRRMLGFDNERLAAVPVPQGSGAHEFMQTQLGSDEPVAYDSCRPIEVAVNPEGAPHNYDELVDHELGHLVGLGHVDDPQELMHEDGSERNTFGPGDLEGLARLGGIGC